MEAADHGKMDCFGTTQQGSARRVNSDQYLVAELKRYLLIRRTSLPQENMSPQYGNTQAQLLLVADGMGEESGCEASRCAVDTIADYLLNSMHQPHKDEPTSELHVLQHLERAVHLCRARLHDEGQGRDLNTTLTATYVAWPRVYLAHAGDSRCYLYRDLHLEQLTTDHTFAQRLVNAGVLDAARQTASRWNDILWNVVGGSEAKPAPETREQVLQIGDALILCTDGLTKSLGDREIARILSADETAEATCGRLIEAAVAAGARDNITVVVARFRSAERMQELLAAASAVDSAAVTAAGEPGAESPAGREGEPLVAPVLPA